MYPQYLESTRIFDILLQHQIIDYFWYVDDILILFNATTTDIQGVLDRFNDVSPTLSFTLEMEKDNGINFLDISIFKDNDTIQFKIYRKPTTTDILIPFDSNHPFEQKLSAVRYLANRLITYPLTHTHKTHEYETICQILHTNKYHPSILDKIISSINTKKHTSQDTSQTKHKNKFATFTYIGKQTKFITKLFKHTNINIAYRTHNTRGKLLQHNNNPNNTDQFTKSGIYQWTYPDCNKKYIGQTERSFKMRYREHLWDFKYQNG